MNGARRLAAWVATAVVLGAASTVGAQRGDAATAADAYPSATVTVSPSETAIGDNVLVQATGWPALPLQASVCGNNAMRGSQDCDLVGTRGESVRDGASTFRLKIGQPPIHCPCVVRVGTTDGSVVRQVPITIAGTPDGPLEPSTLAAGAESLRFQARIENGGATSWRRLLPLIAGPTHKTLVLTVQNTAQEPVTDVRIVGSVGRKSTEGEPLEPTTIPSIGPGSSIAVRIPVTLSVPAWVATRCSVTSTDSAYRRRSR